MNDVITWVKLGKTSFEFNVTGPATGYVAMAISRDQLMGPDDDVYLCGRTAPTSATLRARTGYLVARGPPVLTADIRSNMALVTNRLTCQFVRHNNVTKYINNVTTTWDLNKNKFYLLYAAGEINTAGGPSYHNTHRLASSYLIDFMNGTVQQNATTTAAVTAPNDMMTTSSTSSAVVISIVCYVMPFILMIMM
ncbi:putative ferric-chelate reductase 1 isoform X2 [Ciona intestinalis]